ncbi:MAG: alpha/beta hydrolase family protein [Actinomycetota bacterium]
MPATSTISELQTEHGAVSLSLDGDPGARHVVVLGHGAGGGMNSEFMAVAASGLAARGLLVCRFNFPFLERGRKSPDRAPVLEATFRAVVDRVGASGSQLVVLGGKSMGGRIASQIVAQGVDAAGLVFFGYPLHPPGRPERMRDAHLMSIESPMLFVEGTRDPFCPLETLEKVRGKLSAPTEVVVIEDGDHSFRVRKSSGRSTDAAWAEAVEAAARWIGRLERKR